MKYIRKRKTKPHDIIYTRLKRGTNELIYEIETFTDMENRPVAAKGEWGEGGMDWESSRDRCQLFYREWVNDKVLPHSTGNYTQYPVINHNGKYDHMCACACVHLSESLHCTAEMNTL